MRFSFHSLMLLPLLLLAVTAFGEVYKVVDPKTGKVTFTDTPPPDDAPGQPVQLPQTNTQKSIELPATLPEKQPDQQQSLAGYEQFSILQPLNDSTIPPGQLNVVVQMKISPALQEGHKIRVLLNGKATSKAASTTSVVLSELYRGSHSIEAQLIDEEGKILISTAPVTIHVKRASVRPTHY